MKRLAMLGASGRMGQEIIGLAEEFGFKAVIGFSSSKAAGVSKSLRKVSEWDGKGADVLIDFSSPEAFRDACAVAEKQGVPLVSGTTGLTAADQKTLSKAGKKTAVFWAPNTSLGVAVLKESLSQLAALEDYDFQIEEIHHNRKKDAPSGTALALQTKLEKTIGRKAPPALSIRGGGVPGLHRVWALGPEDWLCFEHMALSRKVFARGALSIAAWLVKQKPGVYDMADFLKDHTR